MMDRPPTLFEWAGGAAALERLTSTFYTSARASPSSSAGAGWT